MAQAGISPRKVIVVSQRSIAELYEKTVIRSLEAARFEPVSFIAPYTKSSEASKSEKVFFQLIRVLVTANADHRSLALVALGGGVVGDLAGFAASVYRRGIPFVQLPTTLTAQVDSAIGGKTAIDLPEGKNLLGSFYQPRLVVSDPSTLLSLPERHWSDGFAEVIKYGVIRDPGLFELLERDRPDKIRSDERLLERLIFACAKIKAKIVEKDEFDKKEIRMVLNFGHTAGHAIEAASSYSRQYTHGEAVAIGMLIACDLSKQMGILRDENLPLRIEKVLVRFGLPISFKGLSVDAVMRAMGYDKKSEDGTNCFVMPLALGKTAIIRNVPTAAITEALTKRRS